ncbi:fluoride efflux transporter FluC [Actinomarinicola tropica]|uniref:fluoride efflux transporter FluC n=1 Tax=Actinomarinicola tropica TaxID=2789776 RepID=UPI0018982C24|nr:CrcB family protein [Actinomarinicola tropica]
MSGRALLVVAAVLGAATRWGIGELLDTGTEGVGWATLVANVLGCLLLGIATHDVVARPSRARLGRWQAAAAGFCGGLSTFSTLVVRTAEALGDGRPADGLADLALSVGAGLAAVALGTALGRRLVGANP